MYEGILSLHNILRWVIAFLLVIAVLKSLAGMMGNKPFTSGDRKVGLFLMISAHIMLLVGFYQWFAGPFGLNSFQTMGMKGVMQDKVTRFFAVEHFLGMLIAIILITIGKGSAKKNISDSAKHRRSFWFYFIALVVILASVPWWFREDGIARPMMRGLE